MGKRKAATWEKELYELWWEYLKLSGGYKDWLTNEAGAFEALLQSNDSGDVVSFCAFSPGG